MGETQSRHIDSRERGPINNAKGLSSAHSTFGGVVSALLAPSSRTRTAHCDDAAAAPPPAPPLPANAKSSAAAVAAALTATASDASTVAGSSPSVEPDSIEAAAKSASLFSNPGPYEQAISDGKRLVMVDTFDGFRCDINKQVSPFMTAAHSFHLGTTMFPDGRKSSYSFVTQVGDDTGVLMARIDPSRGSLDGRVQKALLGGAALGKLQIGASQEGGQNDTLLAEIDVFGHTWSGNLKYGSMGGGIVYGGNYIQSVHPNVAMGGEGMYISANQNMIASYGMKINWQSLRPSSSDSELLSAIKSAPPPPPPGMPQPEAAGNSVLCLNYNTGHMAATVNYKRCILPNRLSLGAELQFSPLSLESQVLMGAEYKWQRSKMNLCVDGSGRIQSVLEAKYGMAPGSPSIMFSAEMDHFNDIMKFGYGINIDS
jgi:mitochondrial import receptor subunit TOM40